VLIERILLTGFGCGTTYYGEVNTDFRLHGRDSLLAKIMAYHIDLDAFKYYQQY